MADFRRGIKAGAAAAGAYLILAIILAAIGQTLYYPSNFVYPAGLGIQLTPVDPFVLASSIWSYVFRGIVFGAIFAALCGFIPGATGVRKGVLLSAFLWIVGAVGAIYMTPGWPGAGTSTAGGLLPISLSSIGLTLVSILSALAFGALAGAIWSKLKGKEVVEVINGAPALLVSFALGALGWASGGVAFLIGVVMSGAPFVQPGAFWWVGVLYASVVFLGLPGWILAFLAWKRTRRGESGLKLGVAGGVVMALTGVMLLDGGLAIIGGVLSRRRPAAEPTTIAQ